MRKFLVCIYLVKAAELDVIRRTARNLLRGLNFTAVYTPHFAMCTDTLSEIITETGMAQVENRSVMRFSCSGLYLKSEMKAIRTHMDVLCRKRPETVGLWFEREPAYFEKAATKANNALKKTLKEIGNYPGDNFHVLVINNDILPLFELIASKEFDHLEIARPGNVIQFRYTVAIDTDGIMNWQLVHAYNLS